MNRRPSPPHVAWMVASSSVRRFLDARGLDLAAGIAFNTLLTVVPLVVSVTVLTSLVFSPGAVGLTRLMRWLIPGVGRQVGASLEQVSKTAATVTGTVGALALLASIRTFFLVEGAAHAVWGTTSPRSRLRRLGVALLVVVLVPVAMGVATSILLERGTGLADFRPLGGIPTVLVLILLYRVLPGTHVRWGPALFAALVSGAGLIVLKQVLARGVSRLTAVSEIYGRSTAVFVSVVAVGIASAVFLFGIALAHAVQFRTELAGGREPGPRTEEKGPVHSSVRILLPLVRAWVDGAGPRSPGALAIELGIPATALLPFLERLKSGGLLVSRGEAFALSRPPEEISLWAVSRAVGASEERLLPAGDDAVAAALRRIIGKANRDERRVLSGTSLRDLLRGR